MVSSTFYFVPRLLLTHKLTLKTMTRKYNNPLFGRDSILLTAVCVSVSLHPTSLGAFGKTTTALQLSKLHWKVPEVVHLIHTCCHQALCKTSSSNFLPAVKAAKDGRRDVAQRECLTLNIESIFLPISQTLVRVALRPCQSLATSHYLSSTAQTLVASFSQLNCLAPNTNS